jgi:hypothetical protein
MNKRHTQRGHRIDLDNKVMRSRNKEEIKHIQILSSFYFLGRNFRTYSSVGGSGVFLFALVRAFFGGV